MALNPEDCPTSTEEYEKALLAVLERIALALEWSLQRVSLFAHTDPYEVLQNVAVIPTQLGDVLILETERSLKIHAVGPVTRDGQQDFHHTEPPIYIVDHDEALAVAEAIAGPGRRVFWLKVDNGEWSEVFS